MPITAIVGEQRGDEGKGKLTDLLAEEHDHVVRSTGANNAGHSLKLPDGRKLKLHGIPSGIARPGVMNVIAPGSFVNAVAIDKEIGTIEDSDIEVSTASLMISHGANLILPHHISQDQVRERSKGREQGSTQIGISFAASDLAKREGITARVVKNNPELLREVIIEGLKGQEPARDKVGLEKLDASRLADEYVEKALKLAPFITDTTLYLNAQLRKDNPARVLAEGAQAFLLDPLHGMTPYTTSSPTTAAGLAYSMGVPTVFVDRVVGVSKLAPQSHVGGGPFVTEIHKDVDPELYANIHGDPNADDAERGTTTDRKRRIGYLDLAGIRRAQQVNGTNIPGYGEMAVTKLDWVPRYGAEVLICVAYDRKDKKARPVAYGAGDQLEECTPVYESLPTWTEDIQGVRRFNDLPKNAQRYIRFIEEQLGNNITMIGVGPARDQIIIR